MFYSSFDADEIARVQDFVISERHKCLSAREWQHRLRGYGYGLREEESGMVVTALLKNRDLFALTDDMLNAPAPVEA